MLTPADFGLIGLAATLVLVFEMIFEVPLSQVLTRLKHVEKADLDTAFTLGLLRSALLASVFLAAAWPFADFYQDDRLLSLVAALAVGPIARGLYNPAMVSFSRELNFRPIFFTEVAGKICASALALAAVYAGAGYWAIVVNSVAAAVVAATLSYGLAPYRPTLSLSRASRFLVFMSWFSAAQVLADLNWQFDRFLLGRLVGKDTLGRYVVASDLAFLPTQSLIGPAMSAIMPAFAKMQADRERRRGAFLKVANYSMLIAAPASIGMALTADLFVPVLLGPQWQDTAGYLQLLSLTVLPVPYYQAIHALAIASDRPSLVFRLNLLDLALRVIALPAGFYFGSITGVLAGRGAVAVLMFGACLITARHLLDLGIFQQLANLGVAVMAASIMTVAVLALRLGIDGLGLPDPAALGLVVTVGALTYFGVLHAVGMLPTFAGGRFDVGGRT